MTHVTHAHDMPFGATLRSDGGARFALWAPRDVPVALRYLDGTGERRIDAPRDAEGWRRVTVPGARAGARYQWLVTTPDGEVAVPDPASRGNPDGVFEPCELHDPHAFRWRDGWTGRPWHEAVMMEVHIGTFTPEGTFDAATAQLERLADLGITCVSLMPVATAPGRFGWGYDGVLPFAPHPAYGPPDAFKRFVQRAHDLDLMVLLDVVYNHFGPDGNFLSLYAPDFFTDRHRNAWGDAINFDQPGSEVVREFFIHNALYWIDEFRVDGLRLDAVHAMRDDGPDHVLAALSRRVREATPGRHVHLVLENDTNTPRWIPGRPQAGTYDGQWSGDFHHSLHVLLTGEREGYYAEYVDAPGPRLARVLTHGFSREGEPHLEDPDRPGAVPRRDASSTVPLPATVNFLQNHDQVGNRAFGERLSQLVDDAPLRLAASLLLLSPPIPLLFMGEEWQATTPFLYFADWQGPLRDAVVAGRRREFAHFSAFADEAERARIPDPCDIATFLRCKLDPREARSPRGRAWAEIHRGWLGLRRRDLVPRLPSLCVGSHDGVFDGELLRVRWRFEAGDVLSVDAHFGDGTVGCVAPAGPPWVTVGDVGAGTLGPWAARWHWSKETDR